MNEQPPAGDAPRYEMVYRCQKDDTLGPTCSWATTRYAEVDAHEEQLEPGHFVVGQMERVLPLAATNPPRHA